MDMCVAKVQPDNRALAFGDGEELYRPVVLKIDQGDVMERGDFVGI